MKTAFTADDLYLHQRVSEVDCSSVGERAACTVHAIDRDNDSYRSCIWAVDLDAGDVEQLTFGPGLDRSPRWSPDGASLAFLASRGDDGTPQVHVVPGAGGDVRQAGALAGGVVDLQWVPGREALVVSASHAVDPDLRGARSTVVPPARGPATPEVSWRLPYKADGAGYLLHHETHLFSLDVATGETAQLTDGAFNVLGFDLSSDGQRIAYTRSRDGRFAHCSDLWICTIEGRDPRRMTTGHATAMQPTWSPDGEWVAFCGAEDDGDSELRLYVLHAASGDVRRIGSESLNIAHAESLRWHGSDRLAFARAFRGRHQIVTIGLNDAMPTVGIGGDRQYGVLDCTDARHVYTIDHPSLPSELWSARRDGSDERQLTRFNVWWDDRIGMTAAIRAFDVPDGEGGRETIEGWLLQAEGFAGPAPLLDDIHGGPASYALMDFGGNLHWQILCAQGWSVLALNAVGSASFGAEFCARLCGHWGEYDTPQHLGAIEQLRAEGTCDARVAVAGKSYGGYLSAWMTGHTDLFEAAVVISPVGDIEAHYGTSDGGYYSDPYYMTSGARFDRDLARALSPAQHIGKSTTPTLFLQGKDDERCPRGQSEELFVTLMRSGETPAELVLYPGGTHSFLGSGTPSSRIDGVKRIVEWVTRFANTSEVT